MTGYGKHSVSDSLIEVTVELRSVNNRYLDVSIRMPREISALENTVRDILKSEIIRGKLSVSVNIRKNESLDTDIAVDDAYLENKINLLQKIQKSLKTQEQIKISHLLQLPDFFEFDLAALDLDKVKEMLLESLQGAIKEFNLMREQEGSFLLNDMKERMKEIEQLSTIVSSQGRGNIKTEYERLWNNIARLIDEDKIDKMRLEQEIAIIADKVDITEECVRMSSHLELFRDTLNKEGEVGKKLTFILQEMLREANTMNSKTTDTNISHKVILIKEEIEKLREQAQNLE